MADSNTETMEVKDEVEVVSSFAEKSLRNRHIAIETDTYAVDVAALGEHLPKHYYRSLGFIGTVLALCFGNISTYLGWVLPANSLALINASIGPSANISWVALAYTIGLSVGFLLVGRLSDIFGRRWWFILGNSLALVGAIIAATATKVDHLVAGTTLVGVAGSVQLNFTVAIAELVPNKHRPLWVSGIFFSSFQIACFGPVIAQSFVIGTAAGWRWSYYLDIIVAGLAVISFFFFYHPPDFHLLHANRTKTQQLKRQDLIGLVLFSLGLSLFIIGLSWGGQQYPWKSAHVIATIVVGFMSLVAFVLYEAYVHKGDPLLPIHLFKSRGYLAIVATATVGSCVYYSMNILWPQQISYLFGGSATHRGWLACVVGSGTLCGQITGGVVCKMVKKSRYILICSCVSLLAFSASMVSIDVGEQSKGISLMFMACYSVGIIETCSISLAPLSLPTEDIGAALGALGSIRSAGASVATAIFVAILTNKLTAFVPAAVSAAALQAGLPESSLKALLTGLATDDFSSVPGINARIVAAVGLATAGAAADAFRYVWYAVIAFAVIAFGAAYLTIDYGEYLTDQVSRKMHGRTVADKVDSQDHETKEVV